MQRVIAAALALLVPGLAFAQSAIRINEFMANPAIPEPEPPGGGGDNGFEWIELYNADSVAIDVAGYKLHKKTSSTWSAMFTFPTGDTATVMDPGEYIVVADDPTYVPGVQFYKGAAGARATLGMGQGSNGDGIRLTNASGTTADASPGILDIVVYGPNNTDAIEDQVADPATSIAPNPSEGLSLARSPNGTDTNASGADFILTTEVSMGAANPDPPECDLAAGLVINEVLADPPGSPDDNNEYVEIYNGAGRSVRLEAWTLEWGTSTFSESHLFDDTVEIAAGDWLVLGGTGVTARDVTAAFAPSNALGNASGSSDGVRLVDCDGVTMDTVIYGSPNTGTTPFADDSGTTATSLAPFTASQAIARRLDGVDTNLSADDFHATATLTPGAANPTPPLCETDDGRVVINEFLPNPDGTDAGNEWIELYNNGSSAVRVDGWTIRVATSSASFSVKTTLPANLEIPSHGRILVGEANVTNVQATGTLAMGGGSGGDAVRLVDCAGNVADTVAYGEGGNGDGVVDDSGSPASSLAPLPGDAQSLARKRDGVDTDASAEDFAVASTPTPGAANPELICVQTTGNVKLNEILPDPDGSDTESAAEFIELYNAGSAAVDLDGWQIITSGAGDDRAVDLVLPPATRVQAETWFVIGNANVAEADLQVEFSMGNGTGGDAVYLLDCTGAMVDAVAYGDDNEDLVTDESGAVTVVAPNPGSARALARDDDGVDNNTPEDWFVDTTPTPGATNFQEPVDIPDDEPTCGCRGGGAPGGGSAPEGCATVMPFGGAEVLLLVVAIRRRRR